MRVLVAPPDLRVSALCAEPDDERRSNSSDNYTVGAWGTAPTYDPPRSWEIDDGTNEFTRGCDSNRGKTGEVLSIQYKEKWEHITMRTAVSACSLSRSKTIALKPHTCGSGWDIATVGLVNSNPSNDARFTVS